MRFANTITMTLAVALTTLYCVVCYDSYYTTTVVINILLSIVFIIKRVCIAVIAAITLISSRHIRS